MKTLFIEGIYDEFVRIKFDKKLGTQALTPALQSQLVIFTKSLFIIGKYLHYWHLVPYCPDFLIFAHTTLTVQSVLCRFWPANWANFMSIRPQENVSLMQIKQGEILIKSFLFRKNHVSVCGTATWVFKLKSDG